MLRLCILIAKQPFYRYDKFRRIKFNSWNSINRSHFNLFLPIASMLMGAAVVKFIVNIMGIFKEFNTYFCH